MKLIFQKIQNIFVEEAQNINTKIKGINFLEILKFKLLEKIVEIEEINTYKSSENAQNEFIYENDNEQDDSDDTDDSDSQADEKEPQGSSYTKKKYN